MQRKHKKQVVKPADARPNPVLGFIAARPGLSAGCGFFAIAAALTFPLVFRMNTTVYGSYDHISTDLFANIHYYFWWIRTALVDLHSSPLFSPLFAAPFGSRMNFVNFTGFVQAPISILWGAVASRNFAILFNLIASALGMFWLVRHITGNALASFVAGFVFAFCPNMLVRSYTTFDSTQVQWIPFYTLFLIRFLGDRSWKNILLTGAFLLCNILLSMPYYLVYLPVHTVVVLAVYAGWRLWGEKRGFNGLAKDLTTPAAYKAWIQAVAVLFAIVAIFAVYYTTIVGGEEYTTGVVRTRENLQQLSLVPTDYLMPHPRSAFLKGTIKESYWNRHRPGKDPDSFVAYIGFLALGLAITGLVKGRRLYAWLFGATLLVAFWATLGPDIGGLPTPSGLIFKLYAPFARRILLYKAFVQFGIAGLAGMGAAFLMDKLGSANARAGLLAGLCAVLLFEYTLVPPALSVDLTEVPEIYQRIRDLPDDAVIIETPLRRNMGNLFQGYVYYQTYHEKPLFNPYFGLSRVPERIRPFYEQIAVPLEAQSYANLAALRYLGVTHLTYHWLVGTNTVRFGTLSAPGFMRVDEKGLRFGAIEGLERIYTCERLPDEGTWKSPFDYTFANLYEIAAEPCPVALTFNYASPYEAQPGVIQQDGMLEFGWMSALVDTTESFYYPLADGDRLIRLMRQGGRFTARNLSDEPVDFSLSFIAESADSNRVIDLKWNDGPVVAEYTIGPEPVVCLLENARLESLDTAEISLWATRVPFIREVTIGGQRARIPTTAVLSDFRVQTVKSR